MLRIGQIKCKNCGAPIPIDSKSAFIKCDSCGTIWKYDASVQMVPQISVIEEKGAVCYQIRNNCILGRNVNGYFSLISEIDDNYKQCCTIRNPYVGKHHARIEVKDVNEVSIFDGEERIVQKKKCKISDCLSKNGTAVNGELLAPNQAIELKDNDVITLAPSSLCPLNIRFRYVV